MSVSSKKILQKIYPDANKPAPGAGPSGPASGPRPPPVNRRDVLLSEQFASWMRSLGVRGITAIVALVVWMFGFVSYYNHFVALKSNADGNWADTQVVMQERHHIIVNLTRIVIDYARHERELLTRVTELRVGQDTSLREAAARDAAAAAEIAKLEQELMGTPPKEDAVRPGEAPLPQFDRVEKMSPKQVEALLQRVQLVAEQYPQLKLTENFQQFSNAIIETEHKIAEHLILYNAAVNAYSTAYSQFPGNHYAWIFGFERMDFFAAPPNELEFIEVKY